MRLMFERDMTPSSHNTQRFISGCKRSIGADAVIHFGMHGTVEWLPWIALGQYGLLLVGCAAGELCPNLYIYAANNPI